MVVADKCNRCNTALLQDEKRNLINEIINGENRNYIKVFDLEAGTGKTRTAELGIAEGINAGHKYILARQFNADCVESANNINNICGHAVALAYNNEIYNTQAARLMAEKTFYQYPVLVITHAKYKAFMTNAAKRKIFTVNRDGLIIDEFLSTVDKLQLTIKDIDTIKAILAVEPELLNQYSQITRYIENELLSNTTGRNLIRIKGKSKTISTILKCIRANINPQILTSRLAKLKSGSGDNLNPNLLNAITTVSQLCNQVSLVREFIEKLCYVDAGKLYTTNSKCKMWLLDNNIMLDASGEMQSAYTLNQQLYKLAGCEKVLDHSHWTLVNIKLDTTNAGINRVTNYYQQINSIINDCGNDTLVITNKSDSKEISVPDSRKTYHYNLIGSNKWAQLKNIVVAQTPNIDDTEYILKLLHYGKDTLNNLPSLSAKATGRQGKTRYTFNDPRLEKIRTMHIAETIYQGIKRVNRDMTFDTKAVVIMNNDDALEMLKLQLSGCNVEIVDADDFKVQQTKRDMHNVRQKEQSQATKFINLMAELSTGKYPELQYTDKKGITYQGKYKKSAIRKYLGIDSPKHFSEKVLAKAEVITFCRVRNIQTDGQYIFFETNYYDTSDAPQGEIIKTA